MCLPDCLCSRRAFSACMQTSETKRVDLSEIDVFQRDAETHLAAIGRVLMTIPQLQLVGIPAQTPKKTCRAARDRACGARGLKNNRASSVSECCVDQGGSSQFATGSIHARILKASPMVDVPTPPHHLQRPSLVSGSSIKDERSPVAPHRGGHSAQMSEWIWVESYACVHRGWQLQTEVMLSRTAGDVEHTPRYISSGNRRGPSRRRVDLNDRSSA